MNKQSHNRAKAYLKYSGIAFQLVAMVLIGLFLGQWVDEKMGNEKPLITILCILVFFTLYMIRLYYDLIKSDQ